MTHTARTVRRVTLARSVTRYTQSQDIVPLSRFNNRLATAHSSNDLTRAPRLRTKPFLCCVLMVLAPQAHAHTLRGRVCQHVQCLKTLVRNVSMSQAQILMNALLQVAVSTKRFLMKVLVVLRAQRCLSHLIRATRTQVVVSTSWMSSDIQEDQPVRSMGHCRSKFREYRSSHCSNATLRTH